MSTKIYDAYRFQSRNTNRFFKSIFEWKSQNILKYRHEVYNFLDDSTEWQAILNDDSVSSYDKLNKFIREVHNKEKNTHLYDGCLNLDLAFFVHTDGWTYIKLFGHYDPMRDFQKTFINPRKWIHDYHYQNSADGPDDVSEEDWEARSDKWDELLEQQGNPHGSFKHFHQIDLVPDFIGNRDLPSDYIWGSKTPSSYSREQRQQPWL